MNHLDACMRLLMEELGGTKHEWAVANGKKHHKVFVDGHMISIVSKGRYDETTLTKRHMQYLRTRLRRIKKGNDYHAHQKAKP